MSNITLTTLLDATDSSEPCRRNRFSSRTCERGTDTCTVRHGTPSTTRLLTLQRLDTERLRISEDAAYLARVVDALGAVAYDRLTPTERAGMDRMRADLRAVRESVGQRYEAAVEATRAAEGEG